ncbi:methylamine utilization protein [Cellvibrio sp. UBA7661]|uniref:methylamine utilization protein n=1 Tax=Cellvibrio sp. UBA7661 TaxID=1946311 RepID=UPI002F34FED8
MIFFRTLLCLLCFTSLPVFSAQLAIAIKDSQGKPIPDVVAALVPQTPVDYSSLPTAEMDQREKMFVPKVLAIRVNTQVKFPNSDDIRHHVYSFSPAKKFELRLYHGLTAEPVLFDKPGTVVLGCNIHDSMVAYIYVLETPYFAVSDAQGMLQVNAPAGNYQLQIHHPQLSEDYPAAQIQLSETNATQKTITLDNLSSPPTDDSTDEFSDLF